LGLDYQWKFGWNDYRPNKTSIFLKDKFMFSFFDTPHLDEADKIIRMIGLPTIIGGIIWFVRAYDRGQQKLDDIRASTKSAELAAVQTKSTMDEVATNHLDHMAKSLEAQATIHEDQLRVLQSIDKGVAVLVDRTK
jgi:hypothetical protein